MVQLQASLSGFFSDIVALTGAPNPCVKMAYSIAGPCMPGIGIDCVLRGGAHHGGTQHEDHALAEARVVGVEYFTGPGAQTAAVACLLSSGWPMQLAIMQEAELQQANQKPLGDIQILTFHILRKLPAAGPGSVRIVPRNGGLFRSRCQWVDLPADFACDSSKVKMHKIVLKEEMKPAPVVTSKSTLLSSLSACKTVVELRTFNTLHGLGVKSNVGGPLARTKKQFADDLRAAVLAI